ncbi:hypothetical protein BKA93DRAFT_830290 [Sparassis latifolia]
MFSPATNLTYSVREYLSTNILESVLKLKATGTAGLCVAVVVDSLISGSLCYYLHSNRTGLRRSDDVIGKLMAIVVATGLLTTLFVIANAIAYIAAPESEYMLFFNMMLGKLYINSFLTSLNVRTVVSRSLNGNPDRYLESIPMPHFTPPSQLSSNKTISVVVKQDTEPDSLGMKANLTA